MHRFLSRRLIAFFGLPGRRRSNLFLLTLLLCLLTSLPLSSAGQESEILVGHSAGGKFKIKVGFTVLPLEASIFPGFIGYATGEVGFHSAPLDEPAEDFFMPSPAADSRFILLGKAPGMEVLNDHGSAFMAVGEPFYIGQAPFDTHPLWNLTNGTPGQTYSVTLKVIDLNGVYSESDPFSLLFTPNPPVLTLTNASLGFVTLSWSPDTTGFRLQSSPSLSAAAWTNAPSGATNPITLPASALVQFYRVSK